MEQKYRFKNANTECDLRYNPEPAQYKFYQICMYKNPKNDKYHIKRFTLNEKYDIINMDEKFLNDKQYNKFFETHRNNQYKQYPAYDLELVDYPNPGDILHTQSPLLNSDNIYGGYAYCKY